MLGSPARRLMAKLIDRLILALALLPALLLGALVELAWLGPGLALATAAAVLGFEWGMVARIGQTPGKYLLGLRVISSEGEAVGLWRGVVLRVWAMGLAGAALAGVPLLLDPLFMLGEGRLCLHDRMAKTRVIVAGSLGDPFARLFEWPLEPPASR